MSDNRGCFQGGCGSSRDTAYIDTYRILDSCRDKDCFEDVAVFLTDYGKDVVEHSSNVRTCSASISATNITVNPIPFNRGFYQVDIRIYVKMTFECCVCMSNRQVIEGIAVCDKKAVLFGGEGNVSMFRSDPQNDNFCTRPEFSDCPCCGSNLPVAVVELAEPVVLNTRIIEKPSPCCICCCVNDIPSSISGRMNGGGLSDPGDRFLAVSIGFFSVTRLERPSQFLVNGTEYTVPEKECETIESDDPCSVFRAMDFPVSEFSPYGCQRDKGACNKK